MPHRTGRRVGVRQGDGFLKVTLAGHNDIEYMTGVFEGWEDPVLKDATEYYIPSCVLPDETFGKHVCHT